MHVFPQGMKWRFTHERCAGQRWIHDDRGNQQSLCRCYRLLALPTVPPLHILALLSARQTHSKHRFRVVGPCFDVAPMGFGDLACDREPEPQVAVRVVFVLLVWAPLQRIKDPVQSQLVDDSPAILDFETNFRLLAGHYHIYRRVRRCT